MNLHLKIFVHEKFIAKTLWIKESHFILTMKIKHRHDYWTKPVDHKKWPKLQNQDGQSRWTLMQVHLRSYIVISMNFVTNSYLCEWYYFYPNTYFKFKILIEYVPIILIRLWKENIVKRCNFYSFSYNPKIFLNHT